MHDVQARETEETMRQKIWKKQDEFLPANTFNVWLNTKFFPICGKYHSCQVGSCRMPKHIDTTARKGDIVIMSQGMVLTGTERGKLAEESITQHLLSWVLNLGRYQWNPSFSFSRLHVYYPCNFFSHSYLIPVYCWTAKATLRRTCSTITSSWPG